MPYIIGTAGHIDHGKTSLIKALTGEDTDRLKEEKERGISIDLGFAQLDLGDGTIAGVVDVPGHERFIKNMLAGVGSVDAIDTAMRLGANHPMGPLQLADFIGLDTCLSVMQVLHEGLADSKYRPCPLLVKYVEAGWLGRKAKRGFYDYRGEKPVPTR